MMKADKTNKRVYIILVILFVVYSVIVFVVPGNKNSVFWLSYLFVVVAIAVQLYIFRLSFRKEGSVKSKFYGFPIAQIGVVYLAVQLVLSTVFMLLASAVSPWIPVVLYVFLLGVAGIGLITADIMRDEIVALDQKLEKDVSFMRNLQSKVNVLTSQCVEGELCAAMEKFAENLRYSDPVSSEVIKDIEQELSACVDELQKAVIDNDTVGAISLCRRAEVTLMERNRLCKLNKHHHSHI